MCEGKLKRIVVLVLAGLSVMSAQVTAADLPIMPPAGYDQGGQYPAGTVNWNVSYYSTVAGRNLTMHVYTPPGYNTSRKYGVIYCYQGIGVGADTTFLDWCIYANVVCDNLIGEGKIQPVIIVALDDQFDGDWSNVAGMTINDAIPFVDSNYSTYADADHRGLYGYSWGGGYTFNVGCANLNTFHHLSPTAAAPNKADDNTLFPDGGAEAKLKLKTLFISWGQYDYESIVTANVNCHNFCTANGIDHYWWEVPLGGHSADVWRPAMWNFLQMADAAGISDAPAPRSAYSQIEAESFDVQQGGVQIEDCSEGGQDVGYIQNGSYLIFYNLDFGTGAVSFDARVASATSGGAIELYLDSLTGPQIGTCSVANTGGWQTWVTQSCPVSGATGSHDLYMKFTGGSGYLFNVNWWRFQTPLPVSTTVTLNASSLSQTIEGLGGAVCFYNGWFTAHPYKQEIFDYAFSGLNLSMLRLGNWWRGVDGQDTPTYEIVAAANQRLGDVPILMTSWSPPAYLKSNGEVGNGGTLIMIDGAYDYAGFADYWHSSLQDYIVHGINPTWIGIQNEPDWTAEYDSCRFDPIEDTYAGFNLAQDAVYQKLQAAMALPPKLLGPECVGLYGNAAALQNYMQHMNANTFYGIAHHLYGGSTDGTPDGYNSAFTTVLNTSNALFPGKPRFMTEFGDIKGLIPVANLIHNSLVVEQVSGYNHWCLMWPGDIGLVEIEFPWGSADWISPKGYWLNPSYWSMKHFSYYVQPGFRRAGASSSSSDVLASAYLSPDAARLVGVFINRSTTNSAAVTLDTGSFVYDSSNIYQTAGENYFVSLGPVIGSQLVLPTSSVTTVVLDRVAPVQQAPYGGTAWPIPGTIEGEDYDTGGQNVAYYDTTAGNSGSQYRSDDVDVENCGEGGYNIGYGVSGEWLEYTVNVTASGIYNISVRAASINANGRFHIEFDGVDLTGLQSVPNTGNWQIYTDVTINDVPLTSGEQVMRVFMDVGEWNLNRVTISCAPTAITPYTQIDGGSWVQTASATVNVGQQVTFGPQPTTGGSWAWSGPNGFSAVTRDITLSNIQANQAGTYVATYTNECGAQSQQLHNITVNAAAPPFYVAAGSIASGTGTVRPALPSGLASGDILLLFVETANQAVSISNSNGGTWAAIANSPQGTGTAAGTSATRLTVFWSRYNGSQGAPTVSDSGNHQMARMIAIRGAAADGDPWNVTAGGIESTSDTTGSIPGATTTVADTLVVVAVAGSLPDANGTANFSAWTNANLKSLTERTDDTRSSGNGGALGIATGVKATAGAYGNTAVTHASSAVKAMMSIAIRN